MTKPTDELSIDVNGRRLYGWTGVELVTGIEQFPSNFQVSLTEKYPDSAFEVVLKPGDPIAVYLGDTLVLTGYVDRYSSAIDAHSHDVSISGRSKCQDLIDCSAFFGDSGGEIVEGQSSTIKGITTHNGDITITDLATALAKPFGITVSNPSGDDGKPLPSFTINLGESPFDILTRVGRYSGFLIMDDVNGNLVLDRAGSTQMASGLKQGENIQTAAVSYSIDQRFSDYFVIDQSVTSQQAIGGQLQVQHAKDPGNIRFRPIYRVSTLFNSKQGDGIALAEQEAQWEANRNFGRSQAIQVTVDSWRDVKGTLWTRNAMCNVDMPSVKCADQTWIISQVTFRRDLGGGTTAELVLMPKAAFDIEPILLQSATPANLQVPPDAPPDPYLGGAPT